MLEDSLLLIEDETEELMLLDKEEDILEDGLCELLILELIDGLILAEGL